MGFSAFCFSYHYHLNHKEFQKCLMKIHKTIGSQVECISVPEACFILISVNSADPDIM